MALVIQIGQMRSTATLQKNNPVANGSGGMTDVFVDICSFRCRILQKKSQRSLEQMQPVVNADFEVACRAQKKLTDNLSVDSRIIFNGQPYAIKSFDLTEVNKRHWYIITISKSGS